MLDGEIPGDLRVCVPAGDLIGESPLWSEREQALYWVDVEGRRVRCHHPGSELREWSLPEPTGCIGLRRAGGLVAATRTGFVFLDTDSGRVTPIADPCRNGLTTTRSPNAAIVSRQASAIAVPAGNTRSGHIGKPTR